MTSKLNCPFCQQELDTSNYYTRCHNPHCNITTEMEGTEEMWDELVRTRKALELATDTLCWYDNNYDSVVARNTLDEIKTALEQKEQN